MRKLLNEKTKILDIEIIILGYSLLKSLENNYFLISNVIISAEI